MKLVQSILLALGLVTALNASAVSGGGSGSGSSGTTAIASVERILGQDAKVRRAGAGALTALKLMDTLNENDTITTNGSTAVILRLGDGSKINIGYSSEFQILAQTKNGSVWSSSFRLVVGWVRALVQGDGTGSFFKMKIHTPTATAGVRGTEFIVDHTGPITRIEVLSGTVYVSGYTTSDSALTTPLTKDKSVTVTASTAGTPSTFTVAARIAEWLAKGYKRASQSSSGNQMSVREVEVPITTASAGGSDVSGGDDSNPPTPPAEEPPQPPAPFDDATNRAWFCSHGDARTPCTEAKTNTSRYKRIGCIGIYSQGTAGDLAKWSNIDRSHPMKYGSQQNPRSPSNRRPGQGWYNTADGYDWACTYGAIQWNP